MAFASPYSDQGTQTAIGLAVTEACTNVVRHAYPAGQGEIDLTARLEDASLRYEVADHGVGIAAASPAKGLGFGLLLIQRLADAQVESNRHGTNVVLRFPRSAGQMEADR